MADVTVAKAAVAVVTGEKHITSPVRKQLNFSFSFSETPGHRMVPPTFKVGLAFSINLWKQLHRHTLKSVSQVIPNPVKLTRKEPSQRTY